MKTSSAKAKGRKLCAKIRDVMLGLRAGLEAEDIVVTSSGDTGEDLKLSPFARKIFPVAIECKKHAAFSVYTHYDQAVEHVDGYENREPVVFIEANRRKPLALVDAEYFLRILEFSTRHKDNNGTPVQGGD
jgi:hypothetical protein